MHYLVAYNPDNELQEFEIPLLQVREGVILFDDDDPLGLGCYALNFLEANLLAGQALPEQPLDWFLEYHE